MVPGLHSVTREALGFKEGVVVLLVLADPANICPDVFSGSPQPPISAQTCSQVAHSLQYLSRRVLR